MFTYTTLQVDEIYSIAHNMVAQVKLDIYPFLKLFAQCNLKFTDILGLTLLSF